LVSSAFIAHWLSCGPDSLSESRKRGRVVATAEKTEQRLPFFLMQCFSGFYFLLIGFLARILLKILLTVCFWAGFN